MSIRPMIFLLAGAMLSASALGADDGLFNRRLGLFVHWGLYSVGGWHEQQRMRMGMTREDYAKFLPGFTAERFDADALVSAAESMGATYLVFTAKHHDGFCMWNTSMTDFNVMHSPCGRDLLKEVSDACARRGMRFGIYYSNPDWNHPNAFNPKSSHQLDAPNPGDKPDISKYVDYVRNQITELCTGYGKLCCLFWDIPPKIERPELNELVRRLQPGIEINDRGWGPGDYSTPERNVPEGSEFPGKTEACDSIDAESWGYRSNADYHTLGYLTRAIDRTLSMGGNFLLNVGPRPDGRLTDEATDILRKVGVWHAKVRESYDGVKTLTNAVDDVQCMVTARGRTMYLHYPKGLGRGGVDLSPVSEMPESVTLLNTGRALPFELVPMPKSYHGLRKNCLHVRGIPADELSDEGVVIKVEFSNWKERLPRPIFDEKPELVGFYHKAWEIAHTRIDSIPGIPVPRYMDEGHRSDWIWIWDTCFMAHFCKYAPWEFPGIDSLGNFYGIMFPGGEFTPPKVIGNRWSCGPSGVDDPWKGKLLDFKLAFPDNPPLFAWTEYRHALQTGDRTRLVTVYSERCYLQRWFEMFENFTPEDVPRTGVFATPHLRRESDLGYHWDGGRSGMDNTPRGRKGVKDTSPKSPTDCPNNPDLLWVDAYSQQALAALYISRIADLLGDMAGAADWRAKYEAKKAKINELYWDETDGFYYDILASDLSKCKVPTMASYWTLLAEIPDAPRRARLLEKLKDENWFGGSVPTPSLARKDADFWPTGGYWRGGVWMPTTYMTVKALDGCGEHVLAHDLARKIVFDMYETYHQVEPHTIWECYSPTEPKPAMYAKKKGVIARPDFCGWSALGPISLFIEDVIGVKEANAFTNTLVCDFARNPKGRVGVENYRFGDVVCSVVATANEIRVESDNPFTLLADGRKFAVRAGGQSFARTIRAREDERNRK